LGPATTGLTVVVPCLNEGAGVRRLYREVTTALSGIDDLELLLVDDGSTDDTLAQMRVLAAEDPRVRYLSLARNYGIEAALSAGYRYASKPWIAQLDCDLQFPPSEIPRLLRAAAAGYDVVFGVRQRRQDPLWRRVASVGQHWVARRLFGIELPTGASSFRVVRTAVGRTIAELRLGMPYFLATVPRVGARYTCVPVRHEPRRDGRSRFRLRRMVGDSFDLLFGHSWRPLNATYLVAAAGLVVAVVLAALGLAGLVSPTVVHAGELVLLGVTLAGVGLVGRYLHRLMLDQRRDRPYYIREANLPLRPEDRIDGGEPRVPPPVAAGAVRDPLVVLGANIGQLPVYREARRRGIPTIAVDKQTGVPALRHADEHLAVSIRDPDAIARALGSRPVSGVLAAGGEVGVETWSALSERLHTPYRFPRRAARASKDKAVFLAVAEAAGINRHRWRHHTDPAVLARQADEVGYPLVVKPADSSGKKGISLVRAPEELPAALGLAGRYTFGGGLILEEHLTGRDLTVDVFLRDGEVAFCAVHEKLPAPADASFAVRGHVTPTDLPEETVRTLADVARRLCLLIGLTDGPADFDVFLSDDGRIEVVEVNARLPGQAVPALIQDVYQVDLVAALMSLAVGEPFTLRPQPRGVGILHMLSSPLSTEGVLRRATGLDEALRVPGVTRAEMFVEPGATVPPFPLLGHDVGYLVVTGPDRPTAEKRLAAALERIHLDLTPTAPAPTPRQRPADRTGTPASDRDAPQPGREANRHVVAGD
jgi:biotin carboxylase